MRSLREPQSDVGVSTMDNELKIAALAWAAHEAGLNYGEFVANLSYGERDKVYCNYIRHRREERLRLLARQEKAAGKTPLPKKRQELPPPRKSVRHGRTYSFNTAAAMELYHQGLCDREIGEELGVSDSAIRNWRNRNGLPSKFPHWGWRGGSRKESEQ